MPYNALLISQSLQDTYTTCFRKPRSLGGLRSEVLKEGTHLGPYVS